MNEVRKDSWGWKSWRFQLHLYLYNWQGSVQRHRNLSDCLWSSQLHFNMSNFNHYFQLNKHFYVSTKRIPLNYFEYANEVYSFNSQTVTDDELFIPYPFMDESCCGWMPPYQKPGSFLYDVLFLLSESGVSVLFWIQGNINWTFESDFTPKQFLLLSITTFLEQPFMKEPLKIIKMHGHGEC